MVNNPIINIIALDLILWDLILSYLNISIDSTAYLVYRVQVSNFLTKIDRFLLPLLVLGMASLSYSIFSSSYSSERIVASQELPIQALPRGEPYISIVSGISNDFSTGYGPWWLLDPISKLQVFNPTNQTATVALSLRFNKAFCGSSREISVTAQNITKTVTLEDLSPVAIIRFRIKLKSRSSSLVVVQTYSPVCQFEDDPRLFLGEITVADFLVVRSNDFNFGSQD